MTDFETRLREALVDGVGDAPVGTGLADAARSRARRRRRTTLVGGVAAVVLAAVAVPVGLATLGGDDEAAPVVVDPNRPADAGWRTETWHQATIKVPNDWGYGALTEWCLGDRTRPTYVVDRPGSGTYDIGCRPGQSYGVSFRTAGKDAYDAPRQPDDGTVPDDAWVGEQTVAGVRVTVIGPTQRVAQRILDSMRVVGNVDPNGCSEFSDFPTDGPRDAISVCRYDARHQLVQSELLVGPDAAAARAAIRAAPPATNRSPCSSIPEDPTAGGAAFVLLLDSGTTTTVHWAGACRDRGIVSLGADRELTAAVLYWALSPGFTGGLDDGAPMPSQLRTH